MANLFSNNTIRTVKGIGTKALGYVGDYLKPLFQSLPEAKNYFTESLSLSDKFNSIFANASDLVNESVFDGAITDQTIAHSDSDMAHMIFNDFVELLQSNSNNAITLANSNGQVFCFEYDTLGGSIKRVIQEGGSIVRENFMWELDDEILMCQLMKDTRGKLYSFWDLLRDQVNNSQLNEFLLYLVQLCQLGETKVQDMFSAITSYVKSSAAVIVEASRNACSAFATGGFYGLIKYILSFFQAASSMTVDDDGLLVFTDNSSLVPKLYIAGMLSSLITVATSVVSVVVAAVSKVLSFALMGIGSIANTIFGAASYDYQTATNGVIFTKANSILAPYGLCQYDGNIPSIITAQVYPELYSNIQSGIPLSIQVPGGTMFYSFTDTTYRVEFHPDLIDRRDALFALFDDYASKQVSSNVYTYSLSNTFTRDQLIQLCNNTSTTPPLLNDASGVMNVSQDRIAKQIVIANILIFMLFTKSSYGLFMSASGTNQPASVCGQLIDHSSWSDHEFPYAFGYLVYGIFCDWDHRGNDTIYDDWFSWAHISYVVQSIANGSVTFTDGNSIQRTITSVVTDSLVSVFALGKFSGESEQMIAPIEFILGIPKYDRTSFWFNVVAVSVAAITAITLSVVISVSATKAIRNHKAKNAKDIEKSWSNYLADPSTDNLKTYQKNVKKNNLFNSIFGGTKYSREGLWASADDTESNVSYTATDDVLNNPRLALTGSDITLGQIFKLISGNEYTPL